MTRGSTPSPDEALGKVGPRRSLVAWAVSALIALAALVPNGRGGVRAQAPSAEAPSVLEMLPGADAERLRLAAEAAENGPSDDAVGAAAKVLWGLRRLPESTLDQLATAEGESGDRTDAGQWVTIRGRGMEVRAIQVPDPLADQIELDRVYRVRVETDAGAAILLAAHVPESWLGTARLDVRLEAPGVRVAGDAGAVAAGDEVAVVLVPRVRWLPAVSGEVEGAGGETRPAGWRLLARHGFDWALLGEVAARDRRPLSAEDSDPLYEMLAVAERVDRDQEISADQVPPERIPPERIPVERLLAEGGSLAGHWLELDLRLSRATRVPVDSERVQRQLGRAWYWQIDAFGDLGNTQVVLQSPDGAGEPLVFRNRFPVTIAVADLPRWLSESIVAAHPDDGATTSIGDDVRVDMAMLREDATVRGFFYRLWSYESEYTDSRGGRQVAPLVVAASIDPVPAAGDGGVNWLGWFLAVVVLAGIVVTAVFGWRMAVEDRRARRRRRERLLEDRATGDRVEEAERPGAPT